MLQTQAVVLSTIKYSESSLVVWCFTKNGGFRSFLQRGVLRPNRNAVRVGYLQPMMLLDIVASDKPSGTMGVIREARPLFHYFSAYNDVRKRAICFFMSELLTQVLREEEENADMFEYISVSLRSLDANDDISNFCTTFLINLTKYLGFYPNKAQIEAPFFDLQEGSFCFSHTPHVIEGKEVGLFKILLSSDPECYEKLKFSKPERQQLLKTMVAYYRLHISSVKTLKCMEVLSEVYT